MKKQIDRLQELEAAGWEFSHNENGSVIVCRKARTMEAEWKIAEGEITKDGRFILIPPEAIEH